MKLKVDLLHQRVQLLKEGLSKDDIDSALPIVNHLNATKIPFCGFRHFRVVKVTWI